MTTKKPRKKELIIKSLESNPKTKTGISIIRFIEKNYNKRILLGTLYNLLYSLEKEKIVECIYDKDVKYYRLIEGKNDN